MKTEEIDFPNAGEISSNQVVFGGDAPDNVNTSVVFQPNALVGLFVNPLVSPSTGPDWGLTSGGSLTAEAFISVFQKTSTNNNGIMRLKNLDGAAWASLTGNGLTGWSIRTILGDYYGEVRDDNPNQLNIGQIILFCITKPEQNGRLLFGPTGINDHYFLYDCPSESSITGATATIGEIFVAYSNDGGSTFKTYTCLSAGTSTTDPATFSGPSESLGSYFTSYTPLTGGAQCEYPFSWSWDKTLQTWKFDCGVSAWLSEGATIINTVVPSQGAQGFQGIIGIQGLRGIQGFQSSSGIIGSIGVQGFQGRQGFQGLQGTLGITGSTGVQGFQGRQGFQGLRGFQGFWGNTGTDNSTGGLGEIQYKNEASLSASSSSKISSNSSLSPGTGYSGNFIKYSESFRIDNNAYSNGGTITLNFDAYNLYRATQIELGSSKTLTFSGFNTSKTGQSLTLVLGYNGGSSSRIAIPGQENIYWKGGLLNGAGGETSYIDPSATQKYTTFYFIHDGQRIYGTYSTDYRKA